MDDKHRLFIDFDAIDADPGTWTPQMCAEALLHECGHMFGHHRGRAVDARIPDHLASDWNVASDLEINDDLEEAGCKALGAFGATPAKMPPSQRPDSRRRRVLYSGTLTPVPSLAVVRDTSGSMSAADLNAVTNEVDGIARQGHPGRPAWSTASVPDLGTRRGPCPYG